MALFLPQGCILLAQRPGGDLPPAAAKSPGIGIEDVCAAAVPPESQGKQFWWSPDSGNIVYFKSLDSGFGLRLELDGVDSLGKQPTVLLNQSQIDHLFPATAKGDKGTMAPPPREKVGLEWSPDSAGLLLHSDRSIVWLDRKTLQTRTLISGEEVIGDVQLSPDGHWVGFVRQHNLWMISTAGGQAREITHGGTEILRRGELDWMYPDSLGTRHGYEWSPDSRQIAYYEFNLKGVALYTPPFQPDEDGPAETIDYPTPGTANPTVRVLVLNVAAKSTPVAINTGTEKDIYLPRMKWLPDSKRLAVERLNRAQTKLELLIADTHTGTARTILTDTDPYWINLSDILYFSKSTPQFLWSNEKSGYRHLFLYDLDGKLVRQLTDGKWEVTSLNAVNEKDGIIYYTSTEKSSLDRQLYSVRFEGGNTGNNEAKRITGESGTHEAIFAPNAAAFVDRFSTVVKPWIRTVYQLGSQTESIAAAKVFVLDNSRVRSPMKPALQQVDFITIKSHDGIEMNASMIRPPGFTAAKKYPAVIYIYGGPGRQAVHDTWEGDVSIWNQMLAQRGFIVLALDNRGTAGRGHIYEEYIHQRFEGQEITDLKDAVHFFQALPYIDPERLGIWGEGFGGAITINAMLHAPLFFKAGFAVAPVVDWFQQDSAYAERYLGDPVQNQDGYLSSSPLDYSKFLKGSLLVAHGAGNLKIHPDQSMELQSELVQARKYAEISLYPGQTRIVDKPAACSVLYQRATEFFGKNL
ncbi:S9 family peptidase [Acidisarcina polymorpha]|uniref:S9 family peptidase n=1 Tax=Acidisarcina polymorpha TaxID=2211140 RepID=UPI000DEFB12E|nr:S9 family peptidase [Acidisarcina polymorpha]